MHSLINSLIAFLFPTRCVGCGCDGMWLCEDCTAGIILNTVQHCPRCWQVSQGGQTCTSCRGATPLDGLRVAARYTDNPQLAQALKILKYRFSIPLAHTLGMIMAQVVHQTRYKGERIISFVPLHRDRERWRGFNQAELLAQAVAQNLHVPISPLLIRTRDTPQQAKLDRAGRLRNLDGAFAPRGRTPGVHVDTGCPTSIVGKTIILIDDVASTGTTLAECARTLKNAGAKEVWGLVVARG